LHYRIFDLAGAFIGDELNFEKNITIVVDDKNIITDIYPRSSKKGDLVAVPSLINSHIHTADYAFPEAGNGLKIEELVAPPNGLKHLLLKKTKKEQIRMARIEALKLNWTAGVFAVVDFVEGGSSAAKDARVPSMLKHIILGRPDGNDFNDGLNDLIKWADGVGVPDAFSYTIDQMRQLGLKFKGRPIFIHVSETNVTHKRGDYQIAMEYLKPTALVHGTHLTKEEIIDAAKSKVGIVICPRSNLWFASGRPPVLDMLNSGVNIALGTDNAGWIKPDIWREMELTLLTLRSVNPTFNKPLEVLKMATINPTRILGLGDISIKKGNFAKFLLLNAKLMAMDRAIDPAWALIKRGSAEAIVNRIGT